MINYFHSAVHFAFSIPVISPEKTFSFYQDSSAFACSFKLSFFSYKTGEVMIKSTMDYCCGVC